MWGDDFGALRFRPVIDAGLLIMFCLASNAEQRYAMIEDIEQLRGNRIGPSTLTDAIMRLQRLRLIEALPAVERRSPYSLSESGNAALQAEPRGLRDLVVAGLERLASSGT